MDATKDDGRFGRMINHSKSASNICAKVTTVNNTLRLWFAAAKEIEINEHLVYDYGDRRKRAREALPWLDI